MHIQNALHWYTVPTYRPLKYEEQRITYDHKNACNGTKVLVNPDGIAVHLTIEPKASVHDKNSSINQVFLFC